MENKRDKLIDQVKGCLTKGPGEHLLGREYEMVQFGYYLVFNEHMKNKNPSYIRSLRLPLSFQTSGCGKSTFGCLIQKELKNFPELHSKIIRIASNRIYGIAVDEINLYLRQFFEAQLIVVNMAYCDESIGWGAHFLNEILSQVKTNGNRNYTSLNELLQENPSLSLFVHVDEMGFIRNLEQFWNSLVQLSLKPRVFTFSSGRSTHLWASAIHNQTAFGFVPRLIVQKPLGLSHLPLFQPLFHSLLTNEFDQSLVSEFYSQLHWYTGGIPLFLKEAMYWFVCHFDTLLAISSKTDILKLFDQLPTNPGNPDLKKCLFPWTVETSGALLSAYEMCFVIAAYKDPFYWNTNVNYNGEKILLVDLLQLLGLSLNTYSSFEQENDIDVDERIYCVAPYWNIQLFLKTHKSETGHFSRIVGNLFDLGLPFVSLGVAMEHAAIVHFLREDIGGVKLASHTFGERFPFLKDSFVGNCSSLVEKFFALSSITANASKGTEEMIEKGECPDTAPVCSWPLIMDRLVEDGKLGIPVASNSKSSDFLISFNGKSQVLSLVAKAGKERVSLEFITDKLKKAPMVQMKHSSFSTIKNVKLTLLILALHLDSQAERLIPENSDYKIIRQKFWWI